LGLKTEGNRGKTSLGEIFKKCQEGKERVRGKEEGVGRVGGVFKSIWKIVVLTFM